MNTMIFRDMSYGVYVTTSMDGNRPVGCITNSIMQITSDPATIAVSVNHDNYTNPCIDKTGKFAFSILSENPTPPLSEPLVSTAAGIRINSVMWIMKWRPGFR